jgi:hypothetical protein
VCVSPLGLAAWVVLFSQSKSLLIFCLYLNFVCVSLRAISLPTVSESSLTISRACTWARGTNIWCMTHVDPD